MPARRSTRLSQLRKPARQCAPENGRDVDLNRAASPTRFDAQARNRLTCVRPGSHSADSPSTPCPAFRRFSSGGAHCRSLNVQKGVRLRHQGLHVVRMNDLVFRDGGGKTCPATQVVSCLPQHIGCHARPRGFLRDRRGIIREANRFRGPRRRRPRSQRAGPRRQPHGRSGPGRRRRRGGAPRIRAGRIGGTRRRQSVAWRSGCCRSDRPATRR